MLTCDAIKYSYRQSKDGFVVSFVIHPQEMPADLANADIGSQWQLQLVPLDEHGNSPDAGARPDVPAKEAGSNDGEVTDPASSRLSKQAGMCCKDPKFLRFLAENDFLCNDDAVTAVRFICHVKSRKELIPGTPAGDLWEALYNKFIIWRDAPELCSNDLKEMVKR